MKAERRHELQDNDLSKVIKGLPSFWDVYGNRIMIGFIVLAALVWAIRWRISTGREAEHRANEALAIARESIRDLATFEVPVGAPMATVASVRNQRINDVRAALEQLNGQTDDRRMQAEALVARGDLNWLVANLPELPGAATQPTLKADTAPEQALKICEEAYNQVLSQYADQPMAVLSARFGLAAIAENRGQWDKARQMYDAILSDPTAGKGFKDQAKTRAEELDRLAKAVYIATPTTQPVAAAVPPSLLRLNQQSAPTAPATTQPTPAATAATPATQPVR